MYVLDVAPEITEHWLGCEETAVATEVVQRNHWWAVDSSVGKAIHDPSEAVRTFPFSLVPDTTGFVVAIGALLTVAVEAVNLTVAPRELVAVTRDTRCFPMSSFVSRRVLPVAPFRITQPAAS